LSDAYRWIIVAAGAASLIAATFLLRAPKFDLRLLILATIMMVVSARFSVQIPRVNTNITISDTFIFLVLLVYGGMAGILLAAIEGLFSALRISRKPLTIAFNSAMMVCSTSLTVWVMRISFGPVAEIRFWDTSHFIAAVGAMALIQYFSNSGYLRDWPGDQKW
jgi:hypothetical protein